jgi:serpin B
MEENTVAAPFNLLDDTTVSVQMMRQSTSFLYGEGRGYQLVELPYLGNQVAMDVLLPAEGSFKAVEDSLSAKWLQQALEDMRFVEVTLGLPRFEFESSFKLSDVLQTMGMPTAFGMNADLSGMDGTKELFIKEVVHKAFVTVDEEGTEAAAATAVIVALKGAMVEPVQMQVDRPFFFFIRDIPTGTILFMGRMLDPSK